MKKQCDECNIVFQGRSSSRFCSRPCKAKADSRRLLRTKEQETESFWSHVEKTESCWIWRGKTGTSSGYEYGLCNFENVRQLTHRVSWKIHFGEIPDGLFVCHHCDNPPCVRPDHLFLGTNSDNVKDMVVKKRNSIGSKHAISVLRSLLEKYGDQL